jgi:chorismate mutase
MNLDLIPFQEWLPSAYPVYIISGPCSAETEDQLLTTAHALKSMIPEMGMLRAGVWKPRTRPGGFQGAGEAGLAWMQRAGAETGMMTAVEVANPQHLELALRYQIDVVWLGARTVVNPFSVQEIADALMGIDIPVMIKNPIHPDLKLWMGAIERIHQAGIRKMVAIHRGFHYFSRLSTRNSPMWEITIELKRLYPELPVFCDPSHIAGKREHLQSISQKALDLEMNGLMIESHYDPSVALTDAAQQLSPAALREMLDRLVVRKTMASPEFQTRLEELRGEIDKIDAELLNILAQRMRIIDEIGEYKKENDITILQIKRWRNIILDRLEIGGKLQLPRTFLLELLELVHQESIRRQMDILNKNGTSDFDTDLK